MRLKPIVTALCAGALLAASPFASAKELKAIGVTVGDLANPFFVQITKGAELEAPRTAVLAVPRPRFPLKAVGDRFAGVGGEGVDVGVGHGLAPLFAALLVDPH